MIRIIVNPPESVHLVKNGESCMSPYQHIAFNVLDPTSIVEFITGKYHPQVRGLGLMIVNQLQKLRENEGSMKNELQAISGLFERLMDDLSTHLRKEEFVLFPYIHQFTHAAQETEAVQHIPLMQSVLQQMRREHKQHAETMGQIRRLTNNFTATEDCSSLAKLCLAELQEFEQNLNEHIYLENNILYPMIMDLDLDTSTTDCNKSYSA